MLYTPLNYVLYNYWLYNSIQIIQPFLTLLQLQAELINCQMKPHEKLPIEIEQMF